MKLALGHHVKRPYKHDRKEAAQGLGANIEGCYDLPTGELVNCELA